MEGSLFMSDAQQAHHDDGFSVKQKPNLITSPTGDQPNESGCFDCNICLDTAHDPVVTLCGHLFCWPCIYRWLHVKLSPVSVDHHQNTCPVCKSSVTVTSLVPLYGRGGMSLCSSKKQNSHIPRRPSPSTLTSPITSQPSLYPSLPHRTLSPTSHNHHYYSPRRAFTTTDSTDLASAVMMSFLYPVIGMFGDLVYTRIFGTFTNTTTAQPYQNQRMMHREKSLNRVSIFLFFCILLCLLFF